MKKVPSVPKGATKRRSFTHLTIFDRCTIEIRHKEGWTYERIGQQIKRPRSAVFREVQEYKNRKGKYVAHIAHAKALKKREARGVRPRLKEAFIETYAIEKLRLGWSPEQISLRLPLDHKRYTISHEAIYSYVYAQIHRGGQGKVKSGHLDLRPHLARRHQRRATKGFRKAQKVERDTKLPSIENRPVVVEKREELGHWEDDTIVSRANSVRLKTINERVSGVVLIKKIRDGTISETNTAVVQRLGSVPSPWRKTLTRDRGMENLGYQELQTKLGINCYFAHAYSSYERGSNENTNGLIRRFLPKKTDFNLVNDEEIARIEYLLNTRPRKRLGGKTPYEVFFQRTGVALEG